MKKTRDILCMCEDMEQKVYKQCDKLDIKSKNISASAFGTHRLVQIYTTKKKFDQIAFKVGVAKVYV